MSSGVECKVCGMTDRSNAEELLALSPDYMGLIFYEPSPRRVGIGNLDGDYLRSLSSVKKVGVFVDHDLDEVVKKAEEFSLDVLQLHGAEEAEYIARLFEHCPGREIWKALSVADKLPALSSYGSEVTRFLFDTATKSVGGSGRKFMWNLLDAYDDPRPYMLAGGLGPGDAVAAREFVLGHAQCVGVDLNSRFEREPGVKDVALVAEFLREVRT